MFIENIEKVKSPIIYITLSFMVSSVFMEFLMNIDG